jgi:tetratricopeptide (TPR) repeat protein
MKGRGKVLAFACALSVSLAVAPSTARAEAGTADVSRAETYAAEAFDAYQKKDYQEAVVLYLKALEASPSADVLFNLAKIYDTKLNDRELAMSFYRRYIADPGADPQRVRTANTRLAELRELEVAAKEKPVGVVAGTAAAGGSGADQKGQPAAGSEPSGSAADQKSSPKADRGLSGMQWAGIATGLVGLGGVAVGTVFGLSAKSDADTAKQECDGNDCRSQAGVDAANDASSKANISTVSFIAGGALTAIGVVLLLSGGSSGPAERDTAHLRIAPYMGPGSLGTQVSGRF